MDHIEPRVIADVQERFATALREVGIHGVARVLEGLFTLVDEASAPQGVVVEMLLYDAAAFYMDDKVRRGARDLGHDPGPAPAFFRQNAFAGRLKRFVPVLFGEDRAAYSRVFNPVAEAMARRVLAECAS